MSQLLLLNFSVVFVFALRVLFNTDCVTLRRVNHPRIWLHALLMFTNMARFKLNFTGAPNYAFLPTSVALSLMCVRAR
jgi:hypothetical protein